MSEPKIYAAMCAAMAHIGAVTKSKINQQQHFNYRGIDDVMNALYPVLSAHGLFLAPEVLEHSREERTTKSGGNLIYSIMKIRYTMYASDGSSVSATVIGEGMDSADKSSNKAMAVAMKYAMFQLFCIPTEEMAASDPDRETPPESTPCGTKYTAYQEEPSNTRKQPAPVKVTKSEPYNPKPVLDKFLESFGLTMQQFGSMRAKLIDGGVIENKPSEAMTKDDWTNLFDAILSNFLDGPGETYDGRALQEVG